MHRGRLPVKTAAESRAAMQDGLGLAAEHGFFFRQAGSLEWDTRSSVEDMSWRSIVGPILQQYTESTDGSYVEKKESAFVWHYEAADPDFGSLQVRCCSASVASQGVPDHVLQRWEASTHSHETPEPGVAPCSALRAGTAHVSRAVVTWHGHGQRQTPTCALHRNRSLQPQ